MRAYREFPTPEVLYLAGIVLWKSLERLHQPYEDFVSPSEVMLRLSTGLSKGKRYLLRWVERFLLRQLAKQVRQQEIKESVSSEVEVSTEQAPSDPWLRAQLNKYLAKLTPKEQQTADLLWNQGLSVRDVAERLRVSHQEIERRIKKIRSLFQKLRDEI